MLNPWRRHLQRQNGFRVRRSPSRPRHPGIAHDVRRTWTATLAGVLFRETRGRRFRLGRAVIGAYLTVSLLHGLWGGLPGLLDSFLVPGADVLAALAVVSEGLALLWWHWREAVRLRVAGIGQD